MRRKSISGLALTVAFVFVSASSDAAPENKQCPQASRLLLRHSAEMRQLVAATSALKTDADLCVFQKTRLMPLLQRQFSAVSAIRNTCAAAHDNAVVEGEIERARASVAKYKAAIAKDCR